MHELHPSLQISIFFKSKPLFSNSDFEFSIISPLNKTKKYRDLTKDTEKIILEAEKYIKKT